jgi:hypothetical protein
MFGLNVSSGDGGDSTSLPVLATFVSTRAAHPQPSSFGVVQPKTENALALVAGSLIAFGIQRGEKNGGGMSTNLLTFEEGDRQMVLLAIAELALSRPGWDYALGEIAKQLNGVDMFAEFKRLNKDRVKAERIPMWMGPLVANHDDPELLEWLNNAQQRGGGFVHNLAEAGLRADPENYPVLRPLLIEMRKKYPAYEPSEAVKQEIRERIP